MPLKKIRVGLICLTLFMVFFCPYQSRAITNSEQTDMVILVDRSGSMKHKGGDPQGLSMAAVVYLLDQLELASDLNRSALILFNSNIKTIPTTGLTSNFEQLRNNLSSIANVGGNTDLEEALTVGLQFLSKSEARKQMVLISDGKPEPDFRSKRTIEKFPDLFKTWRKISSKNEEKRKDILKKLSEASGRRIEENLLGVLNEEKIEIYPIALAGIQPYGEELLKQMAAKVTQDKNAFKKLKDTDIIGGLDTIVRKPVSLMNIKRDTLKESGQSSWLVDFDLLSGIKKLRLLILYKRPPDKLSWVLKGPSTTIRPKMTGAARLAEARDENGKGKTIFERIFLNDPQSGHYTLSFESTNFLPPMQVIVEGRTDLRLAVQTEPLSGEVGAPVRFYCRVTGKDANKLQSASGLILNENGEHVEKNLIFESGSGQALSASWIPFKPGLYRMNLTGYLDQKKTNYLNTSYSFEVKPKQAIELRLVIPVRK
jgi:hypothetical protein